MFEMLAIRDVGSGRSQIHEGYGSSATSKNAACCTFRSEIGHEWIRARIASRPFIIDETNNDQPMCAGVRERRLNHLLSWPLPKPIEASRSRHTNRQTNQMDRMLSFGP